MFSNGRKYIFPDGYLELLFTEKRCLVEVRKAEWDVTSPQVVFAWSKLSLEMQYTWHASLLISLMKTGLLHSGTLSSLGDVMATRQEKVPWRINMSCRTVSWLNGGTFVGGENTFWDHDQEKKTNIYFTNQSSCQCSCWLFTCGCHLNASHLL